MELNRLLYFFKTFFRNSVLFFLFPFCLLSSCTSKVELTYEQKPNILFIAIDDLNDWVEVLKVNPDIKTPNINRLAERGMLFTNAHTQAPICAPSRVSIMTGKYPHTTGVYFQIKDEFVREASDQTLNSVYLPQYFERSGYKTMGAGKLWHGNDEANTFQEYGERREWFGPRPDERMVYVPEEGPNYDGVNSTNTDWGAFPEKDEDMSDYYYASWAIDQLQKAHEKPFFLGVGFVRPHVPWYVPQKWLDMYNPDSISMPSYNPKDLADIPQYAKLLTHTPPMPTTEYLLEKDEWRQAVRAYLASVTWTDYQVGRVLDALDNSSYKDNTIVVLFSDHGYHLGEKNRFAKMSLWERDTRVPLIFSGPSIPKNTLSAKPVGLIDIYPTLVELAGLSENPDNEGLSLAPLIQQKNIPWPRPAITEFGPGNISLRTETIRFIQYEDGSQELYDHKLDPDEQTNLIINAVIPSSYLNDVKNVSAYIPSSWPPLVENGYYRQNSFVRERVEQWKIDANQFLNKPLDETWSTHEW